MSKKNRDLDDFEIYLVALICSEKKNTYLCK